jgi:ribosome-associated protein
MQDVQITTEFITLGQLLKLVGEVNSGGDVKDYLAVEVPLVNGIEETRRGKKIRAGDVVVLSGVGELRITG